MADASKPTTADVIDIGTLLTRVERESKIAIAADAPRAPYGKEATVASGTRPVGQSSEDVLVVVDGSTRVAFPQSAVLTAIRYGIIPRSVVEAVLAAQKAA